jgi:hypothetical protein
MSCCAVMCCAMQVTKNPLDPLKNTFYYLRQRDVIHEETPEEVCQCFPGHTWSAGHFFGSVQAFC